MNVLDVTDRCLKNIEQLQNGSNHRTLAFKHFSVNLKLLISEVEKCLQEIDHKLYKRIILCLSQVKKVIPILQDIVNKNEEYGVKEKVWFLCDRLHWCISELRRVFGEKTQFKDLDEDISGTFVHYIDYSLQILSVHQDISLNCRWKSVIDNLLCQALTIAKISNETDFKEITAICKKVLEGSTKLLALKSTVSKHMAELMAGDLVSLEQRVNTAVLRLVLQVFSDSNKPLRNLVSFCGKVEENTENSLEFLISELDTHSDRIFHIGNFSMACSEDSKRIQGIKCCLASLESLDNYLAPALTAFYLDNENPGKRAFIKFLTLHWQQEIAAFQVLLDGIIDSSAFCQVCLEDISEKVENLKKNVLVRNNLDGELLNSIIKVGQKLHKHLEYNKLNMRLEPQLVQEISIALNECNAAKEMYFSSNRNIDIKSVMKRCMLLLNNIQNMSKHFSQVVNSPDNFTEFSSANFPESIRDLPLDISENEKSRMDYNGTTWIKKIYLNHLQKSKYLEEKGESNNELDELKPYLSVTTERNNTFYVKTPRKVKNIMPNSSAIEEPTNFPTQDQTNAIGIDISDILDNLTSLSDTLTSNVSENRNISLKCKISECSNQSAQISKDSVDLNYKTRCKILSSYISSHLSLTSVKTEEISDINTPDRLQDLKSVEAKIEMLKLGNV